MALFIFCVEESSVHLLYFFVYIDRLFIITKMSFTSITEKGKLSVYDQNYRSEKKLTDHKTMVSSNYSYINVE